MNKNRIISFSKSIISNSIIILVNAFVVYISQFFIRGFVLGPWWNALLIIIGVLILNSIIWPIFRRVFMWFIMYTFGVGALFMNVIIFYISTLWIPEVYVGIYAFFQIPFLLAIVTTVTSYLLNSNYYDDHVKNILNHAIKQKHNESKYYSGLIMLEIDGLSINTLNKAIGKGLMPTVNKLINETHTLKEWETDLSSQTGASQAGILHGNNKDIVAYRWVEKENNNQIVISGKLSHAPLLEKRISNGDGLLVNGISIANMFSGDSKITSLTSSTSYRFNKTLKFVFLDAFNFQRIFVLFLWEIFIEMYSQVVHIVKNIQPRLRRTIIYAGVRAGANVVLREITTEVLTAEIFKGEIDTAYASYVGYDEVAHHSGTEDRDVWGVLKQIDLQFQRLLSAIEMADRNYEIVILSDHGQSNGSTFKQRYGISLGNYVRKFLPDDMKMYKTQFSIDHFRDIATPRHDQFLKFAQRFGNIRFDLFDGRFNYIRAIFEEKKPKIIFENQQYLNLRKSYSNSLEYITGHESIEHSTKKAKDSELIVLGSGNLGLIYLTQWRERLNYEELVLLFPDLIPGLVNHPGIGFILVNSAYNGGMVIGKDGIYYLDRDELVGENPLKNFGVNASKHLKRQNSFKNMPDIMVNSFHDPQSGEVCAFEELIGSHGGLGGNQTKPFILYPKEWDAPDELIGAESIYKFLKNEINKLDS